MNEIFLNRCRACAGLQENSRKMISLFSEKNISEMFTNCTSLEIDSHDCLPSYICFECFGHLSNFNKFRQSCVNSDKFLREQLVTESFKVEPFDENCIKQEADEPIANLESEFHEIKFTEEDFSHSDTNVKSPIKPTEDNISHGDRISIVNNPVRDAYFNPLDDTKYLCDICRQQFDKKSHIGSHMSKHRNEIIGKVQAINFPCDVNGCVKSFANKCLLDKHRKNVHNVKPEPREKQKKLPCRLCPKQFLIQLNLEAHIREVHEGLKPYKCPHCGIEFCTIRPFKHHLIFKHGTSEKKIYRCTYPECDKEYNIRESLRIHINHIHLGMIRKKVDQNLVCEQCGRVFKNGSKLKEHTYSHTGVLPFACKTCPKTFLTKYQLKLHIMRHLNIKPFVCPTCGLRKTTNKELQAHMNFHSKEKTYPCKECTRVFPSHGAFNRHVRIHHRNHRPYVCPHCQRAFAKAETMKNHVMTHTGEKPFGCTECGHRFIQSVALKTHMKIHAKK